MNGFDSVSLDHLDSMTDSTGLVQHAIYAIPRRESGYTTDDNARALRLCVRLWRLHPSERMLRRVTTYLSFLEYAHRPGRCFHNFMGYDRHWLDAEGGGDCQGQVVRALAEVSGSNLPADYRDLADELIESLLPVLADLRSLRAQAYVILAWEHLWREGVKNIDTLESIAWLAVERLLESYRRSQRPDWHWYESRMTYANAVLPHALFVAARRWPGQACLETAEASFAFLDQETHVENVYWPVGNHGWYPHGEDRARYDQQPIEAAMMAEAAHAAFELLNGQGYLTVYARAHDWFHGRNSLGVPVADVVRGTCYDGLHTNGVNRNQGAESTLAYLSTELKNLEIRRSLFDRHSVDAATA